jgi:hypothetical protein
MFRRWSPKTKEGTPPKRFASQIQALCIRAEMIPNFDDPE